MTLVADGAGSGIALVVAGFAGAEAGWVGSGFEVGAPDATLKSVRNPINDWVWHPQAPPASPPQCSQVTSGESAQACLP